MAADAEPLEILLHLPLLCEDKVGCGEGGREGGREGGKGEKRNGGKRCLCFDGGEGLLDDAVRCQLSGSVGWNQSCCAGGKDSILFGLLTLYESSSSCATN